VPRQQPTDQASNPSRLCVAFDVPRDSAGNATGVGEFVIDRGFSALSREFFPAFELDVRRTSQLNMLYFGWVTENMNLRVPQAEVDKLCDCPPSDNAARQCLFLIYHHTGLMLVALAVCSACGSCGGVDEKADVFLLQAPTPNKLGFGITVAFARDFVRKATQHGHCVSHALEDVRSNPGFITTVWSLLVQPLNLTLSDKVKSDVVAYVTYDRLQKALYSCLANFKVMDRFQKTSCLHHHGGQIHSVVVDAVWLAMSKSQLNHK
jgi:hypothetical protein